MEKTEEKNIDSQFDENEIVNIEDTQEYDYFVSKYYKENIPSNEDSLNLIQSKSDMPNKRMSGISNESKNGFNSVLFLPSEFTCDSDSETVIPIKAQLYPTYKRNSCKILETTKIYENLAPSVLLKEEKLNKVDENDQKLTSKFKIYSQSRRLSHLVSPTYYNEKEEENVNLITNSTSHTYNNNQTINSEYKFVVKKDSNKQINNPYLNTPLTVPQNNTTWMVGINDCYGNNNPQLRTYLNNTMTHISNSCGNTMISPINKLNQIGYSMNQINQITQINQMNQFNKLNSQINNTSNHSVGMPITMNTMVFHHIMNQNKHKTINQVVSNLNKVKVDDSESLFTLSEASLIEGIKSSNIEKKKKKKKVNSSCRDGDWICSECQNLNFSFRTICNKCSFSKITDNKEQ